MDALTDILETVHLRGTVYCRSELTAPWGMAVPRSRAAQFHVVRRGRCWLRLEDDGAEARAPALLEAGDVLVLPLGHAHVLADSPATRALPLADLVAASGGVCGATPLVHGGGGEAVTLICGYFEFETGAAHPLLEVLPPVILLRGEGGHARSWLMSTLDLIADEATAGRPGGETLVDRLTEAMFIQVLRSTIEAEAGRLSPSWLAGLRDGSIAKALGLIHRQPEERWTVESLAEGAGMSRSAFATRFRELVGEPPLQYLTRWRMQVAAGRLRSTGSTLSEIAGQVGYETEASFSKVFKKLLGVSPGAFRRGATPTPPPA